MADLFDDLPNVINPVTIDGHVVDFMRHHVIPTDTFDKSDFLKALQAKGLWDQNNFKINGVALASKIDNVLATDVLAANPNLKAVVGGALHTGGHPNYNAGVTSIVARFDSAYKALQARVARIKQSEEL
jgi:hypothetical protein